MENEKPPPQLQHASLLGLCRPPLVLSTVNVNTSNPAPPPPFTLPVYVEMSLEWDELWGGEQVTAAAFSCSHLWQPRLAGELHTIVSARRKIPVGGCGGGTRNALIGLFMQTTPLGQVRVAASGMFFLGDVPTSPQSSLFIRSKGLIWRSCCPVIRAEKPSIPAL